MKSKVLLVYPHFYQYSEWKWIPTSLVFLASTLKAAGFQPVLIDDRFSRRKTLEQIDKLLSETVLVGIAAATGSQLRNARKLANYVKKNSSVPIVFGGSFASAKPEMLLEQEKSVDYVIVGQGERPLIGLVESVTKGVKTKDLNKIPNLYYRHPKTNKPTKTPALLKRVNINSLPPLPYFDKAFMHVEEYQNPSTRAINYTTSAGCVGNCAFCYWHPSYTYSMFDPDRVINDLKTMKKKFNILNINFDDPTFFIGPKRIRELLKLMIKAKLNVKWRANGRIDTLKLFTLEDMKLAREAGCEVIHIGLEHASPRVIQLMGKRIDPYDSLKLLEVSKETGIVFRFHLLLGNPMESLKDLRLVGSFILDMQKVLKEFDYTINWFTPYPGCYETTLAEQCGYKPPSTLEGFENIELMNYIKLPEDDRQIVHETNPWDVDYKVPWFTLKFNANYVEMFRKVIPRKEEFRTTAGVVESQYEVS